MSGRNVAWSNLLIYERRFFEKGRHLVKTGPELFLTTRYLVETGNGLVQNFSGQDCGRPEKFVRLFPERVQRRCASSLYREKGDTKSPGKQQELICRGFNVFFGILNDN